MLPFSRQVTATIALTRMRTGCPRHECLWGAPPFNVVGLPLPTAYLNLLNICAMAAMFFDQFLSVA
jgi:hypothetical protein